MVLVVGGVGGVDYDIGLLLLGQATIRREGARTSSFYF